MIDYNPEKSHWSFAYSAFSGTNNRSGRAPNWPKNRDRLHRPSKPIENKVVLIESGFLLKRRAAAIFLACSTTTPVNEELGRKAKRQASWC
jgi:hypothetical protein